MTTLGSIIGVVAVGLAVLYLGLVCQLWSSVGCLRETRPCVKKWLVNCLRVA